MEESSLPVNSVDSGFASARARFVHRLVSVLTFVFCQLMSVAIQDGSDGSDSSTGCR